MRDYEDEIKDASYGGFGVFMAFLGGAVTGAATALLFAPKAGNETRQQIKHIASRAKDRVKRVPDQLREAGGQLREQATSAYENVVESTGSTRH
ncbi:YtxH domain-containing protein [Myxococcota bacterium]|nr:YtxH domain-containing protein [Myxococcota bacterium]